MLQGSQRKSSPPLEVFKLFVDVFKAFELLDEAAILAMAAAAAANILLLLLLDELLIPPELEEPPLPLPDVLFCMRAEGKI